MDSRKLILLVGALVVALVTAFMARSLMVGTPAPNASAAPQVAQQPQNTTEVLVANRELPPGTILDPESVKFVPWPNEMIEGAYYKKDDVDPKSLQGTVVRFAIPAGQPLTQGSLVKPGDRGFLAAALTPGMRAVTIPVETKSAVAGFVFPGDRVDLILTQDVPGGGDGPPLWVSETVLRNVRVLATDQRTDKQTDDKGNTVVTTYGMVTVEATPKIAEKLALMQGFGKLSLSLRSIADNQGELEEAIANGDVSMPDDPKAEKKIINRVATRPSEGGGSTSTGADISRYQRSTVPGKPKELRGPPSAGSGGPYPGAPAPVPVGPQVTIARGNNVTVVPVGGKD